MNIAIIGAGGCGSDNLKSVSSENIVALCDVNARNLDATAAKHPGAQKFSAFRKVFERARDFNAVVVSTREHTHAFATMLALQLHHRSSQAAAGLNCYHSHLRLRFHRGNCAC